MRTPLVMSRLTPLDMCCIRRPEVAAAARGGYADLGGWPAASQLPICYAPAYNIGFWGLERLHPFDSKKFQHVLALLEAGGVLEGHVVLWANTAFESRSNENITAQQEEVRREVGGWVGGAWCMVHGVARGGRARVV